MERRDGSFWLSRFLNGENKPKKYGEGAELRAGRNCFHRIIEMNSSKGPKDQIDNPVQCRKEKRDGERSLLDLPHFLRNVSRPRPLKLGARPGFFGNRAVSHRLGGQPGEGEMKRVHVDS